MCVVLTTGYKGIVTTDVLAPRLKSQLETFDEAFKCQVSNGRTLGVAFEREDPAITVNKLWSRTLRGSAMFSRKRNT
jgi:hypothetical protein